VSLWAFRSCSKETRFFASDEYPASLPFKEDPKRLTFPFFFFLISRNQSFFTDFFFSLGRHPPKVSFRVATHSWVFSIQCATMDFLLDKWVLLPACLFSILVLSLRTPGGLLFRRFSQKFPFQVDSGMFHCLRRPARPMISHALFTDF